MSKTRRHFSPEFKAQIVLVLLREEHTVNELAARYQISPVVYTAPQECDTQNGEQV